MNGWFYGIAVVSTLLCSALGQTQSSDAPSATRKGEHGELLDRPRPSEDTLRRLRDNGVSPDDDEALIRAVESRNPMPASAAYALGWRPRTDASVRALRGLAESQNDGFALAAYGALSRLGAEGWQDDAVERLSKMKHLEHRLELAGDLAHSGRYDGWSLVRETILSQRDRQSGTFLLALVVSLEFRGMKDSDGKPGAAFKDLREQNHRAATGETKNALADWLRYYTSTRNNDQ